MDLTPLLAPRSVAVVGATSRRGAYADETLRNLTRVGFRRRVWGLHPTRRRVHGRVCVPTLAGLPQPVDAVVVAIPAEGVPDAIEPAGARGCGGAVVYGAGFGESAGGAALDDALRAAARRHDLPVCGPNCDGIVALHAGAALWGDAFVAREPGRVALVSLSGNVAVNALAAGRGLRLHTVVSCGNQAVVDAVDWLQAIARQDGVRSVALFLESDGDGAKLCEALATCIDAGVGVAVLKAGASAAGASAAAAHAGAIAGDHAAFRAVVEEAGAAWARDVHEPVGAVRRRDRVRAVARRRAHPGEPGSTARFAARHRGLLGLRAPLRRHPPQAAHRRARHVGGGDADARGDRGAARRRADHDRRRLSRVDRGGPRRSHRRPAAKDALFGQGVIAAYGGPKDEGTASIKLMHYQGDLEGQGPVWGYVKGGMGMVSFALADAAQEAGAVLACGVPVAAIVPEEGVVLEDGTRIRARTVVCNADPKVALRLLDGQDAVPADYRERLEAWKVRSPVVKFNAALTALPQWTAAPGETWPARATIDITGGLEDAQRCFEACERGEPAVGFGEIYIQTGYDPSPAPVGHHLLSVFGQYAPYELAEGTWDARCDEVARQFIDLIERFAPGFEDRLLAYEVLGPPDIEARIGLTGGNIFQGEVTPAQMWEHRLTPRTPVPGLYLCGAATHPGGSVIALNGRNAARAVLADERELAAI